MRYREGQWVIRKIMRIRNNDTYYDDTMMMESISVKNVERDSNASVNYFQYSHLHSTDVADARRHVFQSSSVFKVLHC